MRWGILQKPLQFAPVRNMHILFALARVHNFCVRERQPLVTDDEDEDSQSGDTNIRGDTTPLTSHDAAAPSGAQATNVGRRRAMTAMLAHMGARRKPRRN